MLTELFSKLIEFRDKVFHQAASITDEDEFLKRLDDTDSALSLLRIIAIDLKGLVGETPLFDEISFIALLGMVERWIHFTNHPRYLQIREAEKALLLQCAEHAQALAAPLLALLPLPVRSGPHPELVQPLVEQIVGLLQPYVADSLLKVSSQ